MRCPHLGCLTPAAPDIEARSVWGFQVLQAPGSHVASAGSLCEVTLTRFLSRHLQPPHQQARHLHRGSRAPPGQEGQEESQVVAPSHQGCPAFPSPEGQPPWRGAQSACACSSCAPLRPLPARSTFVWPAERVQTVLAEAPESAPGAVPGGCPTSQQSPMSNHTHDCFSLHKDEVGGATPDCDVLPGLRVPHPLPGHLVTGMGPPQKDFILSSCTDGSVH